MDTDFKLIKQMRQGDEAAFDLFIHKYYSDILRYCTYHCHDSEEAKDLTQDTFMLTLVVSTTQQTYSDILLFILYIASFERTKYNIPCWRCRGYELYDFERGKQFMGHFSPDDKLLLHRRPDRRCCQNGDGMANPKGCEKAH